MRNGEAGSGKQCCDCLDWVGSNNYSIKSFIREAGRRGCCRRSSSWPSWLIPGKSRVFLAHRGGYTRSGKAVVFGYFKVAGVDSVLASWDMGGYHQLSGDERKHFMQDRYTMGFGPAASLKLGESTEEQSSLAKRELVDGLVETLRNPDPNIDEHSWPRNGIVLSAFQTVLEEERECSFRPGVKRGEAIANIDRDLDPGLYFVDALTRMVDRELGQRLAKRLGGILTEIQELSGAQKVAVVKDLFRDLVREAEQRTKGRRLRKGIKEFDDAVRAAQKSIETESLPPALEGYATARGSLVVFNEPFPIYYRHPHPHFRDFIPIDGDRLLEKIIRTYPHVDSAAKEIVIPYCIDHLPPVLPDHDLSMSELIAHIAFRCQTSKALARDFVDAFHDLLAEHLRRGNRFPVAGLGTFELRLRNARTARNPITGDPVAVPAKKVIRFKAAKRLKRDSGAGPVDDTQGQESEQSTRETKR